MASISAKRRGCSVWKARSSSSHLIVWIPEPVGQRGVDLERLLGSLHLLLLAECRDRAHVVGAVGELDQHHPQILRHRHDHLAIVLDLGLLAAGEADPGELGDTVHQERHVRPNSSLT